MGGFSAWHWMLFLIVALLVFGGSGRISSIMGDVAKGVKSFKKGLADDDEEDAAKRKADAQKAIDEGARRTQEQTGDKNRMV